MIVNSIFFRATIDNVEGEVNVLKASITKLQNGLDKADEDIKNQFKSTVEVNNLNSFVDLLIYSFLLFWYIFLQLWKSKCVYYLTNDCFDWAIALV